MRKKIAVLTGSGISKESGIPTFRDGNDALWNNYNINDVATAEAWEKNPEMLLGFYNEIRKKLKDHDPNQAHIDLARLQGFFDVSIVTQNADDLHERAGSKKIIHIHGELTKARGSSGVSEIIDVGYGEVNVGDLSSNGTQLRPHIVLFGEGLYKFQEAINVVKKADLVIIIGTSFTVYPAAELLIYAKQKTPVYIIDPCDPPLAALRQVEYVDGIGATTSGKYTHYRMPATIGVAKLFNKLTQELSLAGTIE